MSHLLFMDESGHDHRATPYEVRGGVVLHATRVWDFVCALQDSELSTFGVHLHEYGSEIKGSHLLEKKRFEWAGQLPLLDDEARRKHAKSFLERGLLRKTPNKIEFTAYGQACTRFVSEMFRLLRTHGASIIASAIPRGGLAGPQNINASEFLRKDHVFLFERYFYLLEKGDAPGLIVMDESDETLDRDFVRRMQRYFTRTQTGRYRTARIVPVPFFVSSDMTALVQVADVVIYCLNWGFRLPDKGMDAPVRSEIATEFGPYLQSLQFRGDGYKDGQTFWTYGIVFVPDPLTARRTP